MNPVIIIIPNIALFLLALAPYLLIALRYWRRRSETRAIPHNHGLLDTWRIR